MAVHDVVASVFVGPGALVTFFLVVSSNGSLPSRGLHCHAISFNILS